MKTFSNQQDIWVDEYGVVHEERPQNGHEHTSYEGIPRIWNATDLKPAAQPDWLAKGRLPRSSVSLLVGDEGIGKSLLWVWVASAITTGKPLPEFGIPARDPANIIVVVTEDDWSSAVRPRLEVAGVDLARVQVICTEADGSGSPTFPRDLYLIDGADPAPALVVVDAWLDTVPPGLSVRDPQQARQALHPWRETATTTGAAVLLLTHTNRAASTNPRDKYGATAELRKKARLTLFAQADDDGQLLVGPEKSNLTAPTPASTFAIQPVQHFPATEDDDGSVPPLVYVGDSDRTAREHIVANTENNSDDAADADRRNSFDAAIKWLNDYLLLQSVFSKVAKADAAKAGIKERTLQRAAQKLGVVTKDVGFPRTTWWTLPDYASDVSGANDDNTNPVSDRRGATVATGDDLHKRNGATEPLFQSCQAHTHGATA